MKSLKEQIQEIEGEMIPFVKEAERLRADPTVSTIDAMKPIQWAYWFYYKKLNRLLEQYKNNRI